MRVRIGALPLTAAMSLLCVCVGAALAASGAGTVRAAANSALGTTIVVDSSGFTLYHLTSEKNGSIGCTGGCRKIWPPLLVTGKTKPVAGAGLVAAKLGTIKRPDGGVQVTYNGYALYLYGADKRPGQVNGQGAGASWYAITPAGPVTKATAKTSGASSTTSSAPSNSTSTTTAAAATTTTPAANGATDTADGCPQGTAIPQNGGGDADDDNSGGQSDGDGCV
jgi:predicted lipoprotein with Yx(FWY)xxD motif